VSAERSQYINDTYIDITERERERRKLRDDDMREGSENSDM